MHTRARAACLYHAIYIIFMHVDVYGVTSTHAEVSWRIVRIVISTARSVQQPTRVSSQTITTPSNLILRTRKDEITYHIKTILMKSFRPIGSRVRVCSIDTYVHVYSSSDCKQYPSRFVIMKRVSKFSIQPFFERTIDYIRTSRTITFRCWTP